MMFPGRPTIPTRLRACALFCALVLSACAGGGGGERARETAPAAEWYEGEWYVLIHYRDDATPELEQVQWEDRVWRFERRGRQLVWTEFTSPVFTDGRGRYETLAGGEVGRTLGAWVPSEAQLAEIAAGALALDTHGARAKSLRGSASAGFASAGELRSESTSVIGYHERWSIRGLGDLPIFEREDLMGSGRTESIQGRTRYATTEVSPTRRELRGDYARDGALHGRFRMLRMAEGPGPER
jgi:hypothetical protein